MRSHRHVRAIAVAVATVLALIALPAVARAAEGDVEVQQFYLEPRDDPSSPPLPYPPTQAGGHPDMQIFFRLCDPEGGPFGTVKGCTRSQAFSTLKHFTFHLPPGMLGNPTEVPTCPTHLFLAASCPDESQVGFTLTDGVQIEGGDAGPLLDVAASLYNVATLGLEPARLGTSAPLPTDPPGPLPVIVTLRSAGDPPDFGIDSTINDVPFKLGAFGAKAAQFNTVLCSLAPCNGSFTFSPRDVIVTPRPGAKPFFRNPTSCDKPTTMSMEAISYQTPLTKVSETTDKRQVRMPDGSVETTRSESFTPTGCESVPFDLDVTTTPDTTQAGQPTGMSVRLEYPDYANDPIWQAQLKDADVTLPEGVSLATGGGVGLEQCTDAQFGLGNNDPVTCPPGSHIGDVTVTSPALPTAISGKAFFGPPTAPGRPTDASPWKLFLLLEGHGLRIKLPPGDVTITESGQIRTVFRNNPEVPFTTFELHTRGGDNAVLTNPTTCGEHLGESVLTGHNGETIVDESSIETTGCQDPQPFQPVVEDASASPKQAGANSVSHLLITRADGHQMLKGLTLSLPPGAVGNIANAPLCPAATVAALEANPGVNCPESSKVGTIRTTVGSGNGLLTVAGSIYIGEAVVPGDAASFVIVIPAKVGPIDLGRVVLVNSARLRPSDTGVDVISSNIPTSLGGIPLPVRAIDITVDKPKFFLNPSGCDTRTFVATFTSDQGAVASSSFAATAEGCDTLPFRPRLKMIAGSDGLTQERDHPPLKAIVTQSDGEANISNARVIVPDILRPNVPFFQRPGALCTDAQLAARACPALSLIGSASVITPVLPFRLSGPVYIVLPQGSPLPNLAVFLRGNGIEVLLNAKNGFSGIRILNTFDGVPDVPQARFELNVNGGTNGILNAFTDLCTTKPLPLVEATFTGQNGKKFSEQPRLQVDGCVSASARASLSGRNLRVRNGRVAVRVTCPRNAGSTCRGRVTLQSAGQVRTKRKGKRRKIALGARRFAVPAARTRNVRVRLNANGRKVAKLYRRLRVRAAARLDGARTTRRNVMMTSRR